MTPHEQCNWAEFGSAVGTSLYGLGQHVGIVVPDGPHGLTRSVVSFSVT